TEPAEDRHRPGTDTASPPESGTQRARVHRPQPDRCRGDRGSQQPHSRGGRGDLRLRQRAGCLHRDRPADFRSVLLHETHRDEPGPCDQPHDRTRTRWHTRALSQQTRRRMLHRQAQPLMRAASMKERQPMVFVVDDDEAVRSALKLLLKSVGLTATALPTAQQFLATYDPLQPGCLVLDVRMPGMSGLELQEHLNLKGVVIPVIFITGHGDVPMAVEAMQQGAFDFLQKPFRDQDLIDRIQKALAKDKQNRAELGERSRNRERFESLTPREREVLALVASGKPNKVMAAELGVSQRTVEIHRARVMEKMGVSSLAQLVRIVMDLNSAGKPDA